MQEKDYKAIAEIFKKHHSDDKTLYGDGINAGIEWMAQELANCFEEKYTYKGDNLTLPGEFNKKQFLKDCGVT